MSTKTSAGFESSGTAVDSTEDKVKYLGDRPVETAKNGLTRVGSHSRYGFGELRVKPLGEHYQKTDTKS